VVEKKESREEKKAKKKELVSKGKSTEIKDARRTRENRRLSISRALTKFRFILRPSSIGQQFFST
jgi:hypothetical protein